MDQIMTKFETQSAATEGSAGISVGMLQRLGWKVGLGVHDVCVTPAGAFSIKRYQNFARGGWVDIHGIARVDMYDYLFHRSLVGVMAIAIVVLLLELAKEIYISESYDQVDAYYVSATVLPSSIVTFELYVNTVGLFMIPTLMLIGKDMGVCHSILRLHSFPQHVIRDPTIELLFFECAEPPSLST